MDYKVFLLSISFFVHSPVEAFVLNMDFFFNSVFKK